MIRSQQGISLIELMVGLLIGAFVMTALTGFFAQNKRTYAYQQAQASQQEHLRILTLVLGNSLRQAGYAPMTGQRILSAASAFPAATPFAAGQVVHGVEQNHTVTVNGFATAQTFPDDILRVRYVGDPSTGRCNGAAATTGVLAVDELSTDGVQFICTADGTAISLFGSEFVATTQQMRILGMLVNYGLDTDSDGTVDRLMRASTVTDWDQVLSADIEVHFQAGTRPAQANSFVVAFENRLEVDQL